MSPLFMASALPLTPAPPGVDQELHVVAALVHAEFDDHLDPQAVDECLSQVAARFDGASIRFLRPAARAALRPRELHQHLRREPDLRHDPLSGTG